MSENRKILVQSSDNEVFHIDFEVIKQSVTIKNMVQDLRTMDEEDPIPLKNINAAILRKVIQWCQYHKDDLLQIQANREKTGCSMSPFDSEFVNVDDTTLFELVRAADYLEIMGMLEVTSKAVSSIIKERKPEEIRAAFY